MLSSVRLATCVCRTASIRSSILCTRTLTTSTVRSLRHSAQFHSFKRALSTSDHKDTSIEEEEVVDDTLHSKDTSEAPREKFLSETETILGNPEESVFQAETTKLLEIMAKSLYTDKEVFLRELISNASDALEKIRYFSVSQGGGMDVGQLRIEIAGDEELHTLTIKDNGIGMTRDELKENLGTIARSGSLAFVKEVESSADTASSIIGRFGVGFYSVFMVADKVKVYSRSVKDEKGNLWTSDGSGRFSVVEADGVERGTKIIISLRKDAEMFASQNYIKSLIEKYSNFVNFEIVVNGKPCKKVDALWLKDAKAVTDDEHTEFYRFISSSYDTPMFKLLYRTDAPVAIKSVFYVPQFHTEKYGMGRMEVGVNLYSRKVLIKAKCKDLIPDWLRFVKGAVDSEDIPLNISRESMQDSALMRKLNNVLTKRLLKWFYDESVLDPVKFSTFFREFGHFLKEGCVTALAHKEAVAKLLRFESSAVEEGKLTSFEEYISRMNGSQTQIYYLCVPNRNFAMSSPYYESFKSKGIEVIFLYQTIDDFVMTNLYEFDGKRLISVESSDAEVEKAEKPSEDVEKGLSKEEATTFSEWLQNTLADQVSAVKPSSRLVSSPAMIMDHESSAMRRMMKMVESGQAINLPKQKLEINPSHEVIVMLNRLRYSHPDLAVTVSKQMFDNALVAAGLLDDARSMLPRINELMAQLLKKSESTD